MVFAISTAENLNGRIDFAMLICELILILEWILRFRIVDFCNLIFVNDGGEIVILQVQILIISCEFEL